MLTTHVIVPTVAATLVVIVVAEAVARRRHRNWEVDKKLIDLMDRAHLCEIEGLDAISFEVADYASGLMWNTRKQAVKITSIISFINGRQNQYRRQRVADALELHAINASARARLKGTAAPLPDQSSH
jgi:hypothetical protein